MFGTNASIPVGIFTVWGLSFSATVSSDLTFYVDGKEEGSGSSGDASGVTARPWHYANDNNGSRGVDGSIFFYATWGRGLSSAEHKSFADNPYQILKPKNPPVYFTPVSTSGITVTAESGSYVYTGTDAALLTGRVIQADSGSYAYTGTSVNLLKGFVLVATTGSYSYVGTNATLTFTPAGSFVLTANTGAYAYSGTDINFNRDRVIIASSGVYTYSGTDIQIILPGQIWTDKPAVNTVWGDKALVSTTWGDKTPVNTTWTDK